MNLAAVVVTFNRKAELMNNLRALSRQLLKPDVVIIVDNHSNDGTQQLVETIQGDLGFKIDYQYLEHNSGGAGGFSFGVSHALKQKYDWILLMDDDGKPFDETSLQSLMRAAEKLKSAGNKELMLNSLVTFNGTDLSFSLKFSKMQIEKAKDNNNLLVGDINPFNFTLLSREAVEKAGVPREDFFISCDEREYTKRNMESGTYIATVPSSVYLHPKARDVVAVTEKGNSYEIFSSTFKEYYYTRNSMAMFSSFRKTTRILLDRLSAIHLFENKKLKRYGLTLRATTDYLLHRMGKQI